MRYLNNKGYNEANPDLMGLTVDWLYLH